jgi:glucoamylase
MIKAGVYRKSVFPSMTSKGDEAVTGLGQTLGTEGVRSHPLAAYQQADLSSLRMYMLFLMMRNVTSSGFVFEDPANRGSYSLPGSVLAAPSYPANTPGVDQDYVFNWVRDSAITMIEIAEARLPSMGGVIQPLNDYVSFATICYNNAVPTKGHACFTVAGQSRNWTEQDDGPALQALALMCAFDQLDPAGQQAARALMNNNVAYLLENDNYKQPTVNLWEEHSGLSFFARSAQLKCFRAVVGNTIGLPVPAGVRPAITWLENALSEHWNGSYYVSLVTPGSNPPQSVVLGYDVNIDIVQASVYGAVPCTDTRMLATSTTETSATRWGTDIPGRSAPPISPSCFTSSRQRSRRARPFRWIRSRPGFSADSA